MLLGCFGIPAASKIHTYVGVLMWPISMVLTPGVARKLIGSNSSQAAEQIIMYARVVINQLTTVVATYLFHQECQALWLRLFFEPCLDLSPAWCFWCDSGNTSSTFHVAGLITLETVHGDTTTIVGVSPRGCHFFCHSPSSPKCLLRLQNHEVHDSTGRVGSRRQVAGNAFMTGVPGVF